jgi:hypothetical protein
VLKALSELHEHCEEFDPPVAMYNAVAAMTREHASGNSTVHVHYIYTVHVIELITLYRLLSFTL